MKEKLSKKTALILLMGIFFVIFAAGCGAEPEQEDDSGHIPGAVLLPVNSIDETRAAQVIPTKDTTVLVYCRSGNRSRTASARLAGLGYTQVYEFGGIRDWPYETE